MPSLARDSELREREKSQLVVFPTNLTFSWDREILQPLSSSGSFFYMRSYSPTCWSLLSQPVLPAPFSNFPKRRFSLFYAFLFSVSKSVKAFNSSIWIVLVICKLNWLLLMMLVSDFGFERLVWGHLWGTRDVGKKELFGFV